MKNFKYIFYALAVILLSACGDEDELDFSPSQKVGFVTTSTSLTEITAEDSIKINLVINPAAVSVVDIAINADELTYGENFTTFPEANNGTLSVNVDASGVGEFYFIGTDIDITRDNNLSFTISGASGVELGQTTVLTHTLAIERIFLFNEDFDGCDTGLPAGWTFFSEASDANWECSDNLRGESGNAGDFAMEISGFGANTASADWLITPMISLSGGSDYVFEFASMKRFEGPDLQVLISTDYSGSGDPNSATWTSFSAAEAALDQNETSYDYKNSGEVALSASGDFYIAFYYTSNGVAAGEGSTYRIDNVRIKEGEGFGGGTGAGIDIATARTQDGQTVTISGVVITPDYGFGNGQFFVQDATAGINVFWSGNFGVVSLGDVVEITGDIGGFNGQVQISPSSVNIVSSGNALPTPTVMTGSDLDANSSLQSSLVQLSGVTLVDASQWPTSPIDSGSGLNVDAAVDGVNFVIRIDRGESFYDGSTAPSGSFTITGVLGRFNDEVQVMPFIEGDIN